MVKEKIGHVTEVEKSEILIIHERIMALDELLLTLDDFKVNNGENSVLQKKIVDDINKTKSLYKEWWDNATKKYGWKCRDLKAMTYF